MCSPIGRPSSSTGKIVKTTATKIITATERCGCGASRCATPSRAKMVAMVLAARRNILRVSDDDPCRSINEKSMHRLMAISTR